MLDLMADYSRLSTWRWYRYKLRWGCDLLWWFNLPGFRYRKRNVKSSNTAWSCSTTLHIIRIGWDLSELCCPKAKTSRPASEHRALFKSRTYCDVLFLFRSLASMTIECTLTWAGDPSHHYQRKISIWSEMRYSSPNRFLPFRMLK